MSELLIVVPTPPSQTPAQHLDLEILLAYLRQRGFSVSIWSWPNTQSAGEGEARRFKPPSMQPRIVYYHLPSRTMVQALFDTRDETARWQGKPIEIAGGYFASRNDIAVLDAIPHLDAIVRGELELPVSAVLGNVAAGEDWRKAPGLTVRGSEVPVRNPTPELLALDELPPAGEDFLDPEGSRFEQEVLFNRGCNSNCQYCGFQVFYRESFPEKAEFWRTRPAEAIVDEIEQRAAEHGVHRFAFNAAVFFGYDERGSEVVESVAREILRRRLDISYRIVTHPHHLIRNSRLLPLLKESGLGHVYLGLDSGSGRALARYHVDFTVDDSLRALELLYRHRLDFTVGFFFYDPYLTVTELREQLAFLRRARPYFSHMPAPYPLYLDRELLHTTLSVNPQMPLFERLRRDGLVSNGNSLGEKTRVRFADRAVARFHRIHRAVYRQVLKELRPLLWNPRCVAEHEGLDLLALDLLEHLLEHLPETSLNGGGAGEDEGVAQARRWLENRLGGTLGEMIEAAGVHGEQKAALERLITAETPQAH